MSSVRTLISDNVDPADLVHITLISEAYTKDQVSEFFDDVERIVGEAFTSPTAAFRSLLPLLAVHAVHIPSEQDHIPLAYGKNRATIRHGKSMTAFDLRREDGPLRTIAPRNYHISYQKAKKVCKESAPGCDHILLVVRDKYYGGLGDEVAIFTSSITSGTLAIRHELGHILADVGEEYDGGADYSGPNFSESTRLCDVGEKPRSVKTYDGVREVWPCISWSDWLPENTSIVETNGNREVVTEPVHLSLAEWPFANLEKTRSVSFPLHVQPDMGGTKVLLSVAGIKKHGDLGVTREGWTAKFEVNIDGYRQIVPIPYDYDRYFFSFVAPPLFPESNPKITVSMKTGGSHLVSRSLDESIPYPMLCHIQVHQYRSTSSLELSAVGAYPVFGDKKSIVGYRPTLDNCAMRRMQSTCFCPVCLEQLWRRVLSRSGILRSYHRTSSKRKVRVVDDILEVNPIPLGAYGEKERGDELDIKWFSQSNSLLATGKSVHLSKLPTQVNTCLRVQARLSSQRIRRAPKIIQEELFVFLIQFIDRIIPISTRSEINEVFKFSQNDEQLTQLRKLADQCLPHIQKNHATEWLFSLSDGTKNTEQPIMIPNLNPPSSQKPLPHDLLGYEYISPLVDGAAKETFEHHIHSLVFSLSLVFLLFGLLLQRHFIRWCPFTKIRAL